MKRTRIKFDLSDFPDEIRHIAEGHPIYDSSSSPEARVLYIDRGPGMFVKIGAENSLEREAVMTHYFHGKGLSCPVLSYLTEGGKDYLLTERIPGEDCVFDKYLSDPKKLCEKTAALLRQLHETDYSDCPVKDRLDTYKASVKKGLASGKFEADLFEGIFNFKNYDEAKRLAVEGLRSLQADALIHGDYCLPNIILDDWKLSGYIDLGNGGVGDRHIDITWGIWTLKYNLGTAEYSQRFIDAYGRDMVDTEKLRLIAAMEAIGE